jgi:hypothetical protein
MGRVVFRAQVAWIPRLPFFSVVPASIIVGFFVPLTLLSLFFLPFRMLGGLWVSRLHCVYFQHFGRGSSQSSSLVGHLCVVWIAVTTALSIAQRALFMLNQQYHWHVVQLSV